MNQYTTTVRTQDAQSLFVRFQAQVTQLMVGAGLIIIVLQLFRNVVIGNPIQWYIPFTMLVFTTGLYALYRRYRLNVITNMVLLAVLLGVFIARPDIPSLLLGSAFYTLIGASLFSPRPLYYLIVIIIAVRTVVFELPLLDAAYNIVGRQLAWVAVFIVLSLIIRGFRDRLVVFIDDSRRASNLLAAGAVVGQVAGEYNQLEPMMKRIVDIVRDRLGYYHVQIFLTDDTNTSARLVASTGDAGQHLLKQQAALPVNGSSIIGRTILAGEPLIARDLADRTGFTFFQELENTRSELALPVLEGTRVLGALDIHSAQPDAFTSTEVRALEVIAAQLATAIRNARLAEKQETLSRENRRLFLDSETKTREIERLNRQITRQSWDEYTQSGIVTGVTLAGEEFRPGAEWSDAMRQAAERRRVVNLMESPYRRIAIPIELRGEILGAMEVQTQDRANMGDTIELLQAISQRLAIGLDNARLFEETQEATLQEQRISELVTSYQTAGSIQELLQITLEGLGEALGAEQGAIRLGRPPAAPGDGSNMAGAAQGGL
jgi:GAF domain-containing protein